MVMKKIVLFILLFLTIGLFCQSDETNTLVDSTKVDSTSMFDPELIHQYICKQTYIPDYLDSSYFIFQEGFHLHFPFQNHFLLERDQFVTVSSILQPSTLLQLYAPFYYQNSQWQKICLSKSDYNLPVPLSKSFLAMGDEDMNHAFFSFRKGSVFGYKPLTVNLQFITYDGKWFQQNEKVQSYHIEAVYSSPMGEFRFLSTVVENAEVNLPRQIDLSAYDITLMNDNRFFDFGYRYEEFTFGNVVSTSHQLFVKKDLKYNTNTITGRVNYLTENKDFFYRLNTISNWETYNWHNNIDWHYSNDYQINSIANVTGYHDLKIRLGYQAKEDTLYFPSLSLAFGGKIIENLSSEIAYEKLNYQKKEFTSAHLKNKMRFDIASLFLVYIGKIQWIEENDFLPDWLIQQKVEIGYQLQHDNEIKIGCNMFYSDTFNDQKIEVLNAYLNIQISKLFQLKIMGVQLVKSNSSDLIPFADTHFTAGLKWIFKN